MIDDSDAHDSEAGYLSLPGRLKPAERWAWWLYASDREMGERRMKFVEQIGTGLNPEDPKEWPPFR